MDLELRGRGCLITGASSGIGVGIAKILAGEGARIAITARRADRLEALAEEIAARGLARPVALPGDLTDRNDLVRIAEAATEALGQVDILVNNAGGSRPIAPDAGDAAWDEAFALNFTAARRMTEALLPAMRARRWGRIVNISGSMEPRSLNAAGAAKAAL